MKVARFALNLVFTMAWFALGGLLYGIAIGVVLGMGFSTLLCLLLLTFNVDIPGIASTGFDLILLGLMTGGIVGGFVGAATGVVSLVALAIAVSHRRWPEKDFLQAIAGAFRGAWVCALAGSVSGALLFEIWKIHPRAGASQQFLQAALEPFNGGFFWGSVIGFCVGFFAGTLIGGLSQKTNWLTMPLSDVRAEMKKSISALWKDNSS